MRSGLGLAHVHHLTGLSTDLVSTLKRLRVPVVLTLHDYWLLCHRGQLVDRDTAVVAGRSPAAVRAASRPRSRSAGRPTVPPGSYGTSRGRASCSRPARDWWRVLRQRAPWTPMRSGSGTCVRRWGSAISFLLRPRPSRSVSPPPACPWPASSPGRLVSFSVPSHRCGARRGSRSVWALSVRSW